MAPLGPDRALAPRTHVIACVALMHELRPHLPPGTSSQVLDFGLHADPSALRQSLQQAIDRLAGSVDQVILGYGLCSMAVVGLRATGCTLVVPRVDDCIAICLGSQEAYRAEFKHEPGTYYLTPGWIAFGDTPFSEHQRLVEAFGEGKAQRVMAKMLRNYRRLVFISSESEDAARYRAYARQMAERFGLRYAEIPGSKRLMRKMFYGPLDQEFVVARPGETITYMSFKGAACCA